MRVLGIFRYLSRLSRVPAQERLHRIKHDQRLPGMRRDIVWSAYERRSALSMLSRLTKSRSRSCHVGSGWRGSQV
jgi:hypothetical protein